MADEVRSTQYLYEFATKGAPEAEQQFRSFITNRKSYETEIKATLANIDAAIKSGGGRGGGGGGQQLPAIANAIVPNADELREKVRRYQDVLRTLNETNQKAASGADIFSRGFQNQGLTTPSNLGANIFGNAFNPQAFQAQVDQAAAAIARAQDLKNQFQNVGSITPTPAMSTQIPPWLKGEGTEGLKAFSERLKAGRLEVGTFEKALGDSNNTVEKANLFFDKFGNVVGRTTTVTKDVAGGIRSTTTSITGLNQEMSKAGFFGEQMLKHLKWISQGIILWGAINVVTDALRGWWDIQQQLNASLAEFEMRSGASAQGMAEYEQGILNISQSTAQRPEQVAAVAPYAPDLTTMEYAAQLNKVAGGDMQNQMQWLVSQQKQFNVPAEDSIRILNALAAGWKLTTLPMHDYIDMLRYAAPYAQQFNMSIEEMYATFGAAQSVIGIEGHEMDIVFRNLTRLYDPQVQKGLQITPTSLDMPDGTRQYRDMISILDELSEKRKSGALIDEDIADVMGAAGKGQRDLLIGMLKGWDAIKAGMESATTTGGNFSEILSIGLGTTKSKTEELKAAWDRLLSAFGDTTDINTFLNLLIGGLELAKQHAEDIAGVMKGLQIMATLPLRVLDELTTGGKMEEVLSAFASLSTAQATASVGAKTPSSFGATATGGREPWNPTGGQQPLESFPSVFTIPKGGGDYDSIRRSMDQWTEAFKALGPAFVTWIGKNEDQALVYDENTKTLRTISGFLPALQRAISENTQAQKAQAIEPNLRNVDMNLDESGGMLQQWVQYYTQFLTRMGFPQESKPQLLLGEDDTWIRMWASNEALMLALRALTEATEDQTDVLSGQWNVPEGATMWVPIQSLFYSRGQDKGAPSLGDLPTPPTTLPPQQGNWMNLPGAVAQMTVTDMTVMNWEGLMTTIPPETVAAGPEKPSMDPELFKSIIGSLRELDIRKKLSWITEGDKEWGDRSPGYINSFDEAASKGLTASTLEIQSPVTELTSPTVQETIGSASILASTTTMVTSSIDLTTGSITGLPTTDTSGMEGILQSMAVTLVMIYNALQTSTPGSIPTKPADPPGGVQEFAAVSVDELGRYVDQRNYYTFVQKARMRYF